MGRIFPSAWRTKREAKKRIGNPPPARTRGCGLGVPVTKKIEDSWRGWALEAKTQREGRRGFHGEGRKREIEVTAGGYGGGTTIVVLSPVNKGWVAPPRRTGSGAQEGAEDALRPRLPVTAFHIQSFLRRRSLWHEGISAYTHNSAMPARARAFYVRVYI